MKPFEPTTDYTKIHNALYRFYTRLPDFKPDHALLYIVLMSYWNAEFGYAFPTKVDLALMLNCGINKPARLTKVLEKYGLVTCVPRDRSLFGSNDIYYVYEPITTLADFYDKYPEAEQNYKERFQRLNSRNEKT